MKISRQKYIHQEDSNQHAFGSATTRTTTATATTTTSTCLGGWRWAASHPRSAVLAVAVQVGNDGLVVYVRACASGRRMPTGDDGGAARDAPDHDDGDDDDDNARSLLLLLLLQDQRFYHLDPLLSSYCRLFAVQVNCALERVPGLEEVVRDRAVLPVLPPPPRRSSSTATPRSPRFTRNVQRVELCGVVRAVSLKSKYTEIELDDGTGVVRVQAWSPLELGAAGRLGALVVCRGRLEWYNGAWLCKAEHVAHAGSSGGGDALYEARWWCETVGDQRSGQWALVPDNVRSALRAAQARLADDCRQRRACESTAANGMSAL